MILALNWILPIDWACRSHPALEPAGWTHRATGSVYMWTTTRSNVCACVQWVGLTGFFCLFVCLFCSLYDHTGASLAKLGCKISMFLERDLWKWKTVSSEGFCVHLLSSQRGNLRWIPAKSKRETEEEEKNENKANYLWLAWTAGLAVTVLFILLSEDWRTHQWQRLGFQQTDASPWLQGSSWTVK